MSLKATDLDELHLAEAPRLKYSNPSATPVSRPRASTPNEQASRNSSSPTHQPQRVDRHPTVQVLGANKHVIPDIVVFVNGLPIGIIECKSPTIGDTWKAEAIKQLQRYQESGSRRTDQDAPRPFETAQILVATCSERAVYDTVGTPERFFLEWKEPYPLTVKRLGEKLERTPTPQDILLHGLLEPRNLLDIVRSFVVFEVEGGRTVRKLARWRLARGFPAVEFRDNVCKSVRVGHVQGNGHWTRSWRRNRIARRGGRDHPPHVWDTVVE